MPNTIHPTFTRAEAAAVVASLRWLDHPAASGSASLRSARAELEMRLEERDDSSADEAPWVEGS